MKIRVFIGVIMVGFALSGCASNSKKMDKERALLHFQMGTGYLGQGQYPQAMSELTKAEILDPHSAPILNNLGLAYYVRGKTEQAEAKFRLAIKESPDFSEAKINLARVLIDQKKLNEALKVLQMVEGDLTYPFPEKTFVHLGMVYFELGQYKNAENYLLRSLQIRRQNCVSQNYYGRTLFELKETEKSAEALDQAVEYCRKGKFEEPLFYSAMSYFALGNREKSRARLVELLKDYPQSKYVAKAKGMLELLEQ